MRERRKKKSELERKKKNIRCCVVVLHWRTFRFGLMIMCMDFFSFFTGKSINKSNKAHSIQKLIFHFRFIVCFYIVLYSNLLGARDIFALRDNTFFFSINGNRSILSPHTSELSFMYVLRVLKKRLFRVFPKKKVLKYFYLFKWSSLLEEFSLLPKKVLT